MWRPAEAGVAYALICLDRSELVRWWPYKEFVNMIRRAAWTALGFRRAVPANRPPDDRFHR